LEDVKDLAHGPTYNGDLLSRKRACAYSCVNYFRWFVNSPRPWILGQEAFVQRINLRPWGRVLKEGGSSFFEEIFESKGGFYKLEIV
jgi:hypothetical protein